MTSFPILSAAAVALFAASLPATAQVTAEVTGATATQAVLVIRGATAACTLELHEAAPDGPLHPDVANAVDTARPDTLVWNDGTRVVTLGHQRSNLALAAATSWYGKITGCNSDPVTFSFQTGVPAVGANWPHPVPFNPGKWNNADFPDIDWSPQGRGKSYVDPLTGIRLKIVNGTGDFSWTSKPAAFAAWSGGEGWSQPANAANGAANSVASTSNTNPLDLYVSTVNTPFGGATYNDYWAHDNLGLVVYGSASGGGSVEDRQIEVCLVFDPALGCAGTPFRVTLPNGSPVRVDSPSPDPDHAWPGEYPAAAYAGWGGAILTRDRLPITSIGGANATEGQLVIPTPDKYTHFPSTLNPGNRLLIPGSGCPSDLCQITEVTHAGAVRVAESVSGENLKFTAWPWSVRVRKITENGTVSVGLRFKAAGSLQSGTFAEGFQCHPVEVTSGDGIRGHACAIASGSASFRMLYFIANDASVVRRIAAFRIPHKTLAQTMPASDRPDTPNVLALAPYGFSKTDGRVFYVTSNVKGTGRSIYRVTYQGDWTKEIDYNYTGDFGGFLPEMDEQMDWANITPPSQGKNLAALIAAQYPNYNESLYGSWVDNTFAGLSGNLAFFARLYGGQDGGPCWIAAFDMDQSKVVSLVHTLDGTGLPAAQWGNCHSIFGTPWPENTFGLSLNILQVNNPAKLHGGPFEFKPSAIRRNGDWSPDTSLPWPVNDSYDNLCPTDLSEDQVRFGAVGNQCVTFRFPGHPCNVRPSALEKQNFPACNWNENYTQPALLRPGAHFFNTSQPYGGDTEHFLVLRVTEVAGGELEVLAQRNASWDYCCSPKGRPGTTCQEWDALLTHANGWTARLNAGTRNTCTSSLLFNRLDGGAINTADVIRSFGGHSAIGRNGDGIDMVSGAAVRRGLTFEGLGAYPFSGDRLTPPSFAGLRAQVGSTVQQYLSKSQTAATRPGDQDWVLDSNAYNPSYGLGGGNSVNNQLGTRALTNISGDVWKIQVIGGPVNYRKVPLFGWVGNRMLLDISGPSSNITTARDYSMCHALRAGECIESSQPGETFIRAPKIYPSPGCVTAMMFARTPCVMTAQPGVGGVRQWYIAEPDTEGVNSRFLTTALAPPGIHYPYFQAAVHPSAESFLVVSGQYLDGLRMAVLAGQLPPFTRDNLRRNTLGGLTLRIPQRGNATHAQVRFGYDTSLRCTPRDEQCVTLGNGDDFAFASDTPANPVACSEGCEVGVPAISGRILYYRAEWLANGEVIETGETTAVVIP